YVFTLPLPDALPILRRARPGPPAVPARRVAAVRRPDHLLGPVARHRHRLPERPCTAEGRGRRRARRADHPPGLDRPARRQLRVRVRVPARLHAGLTGDRTPGRQAMAAGGAGPRPGSQRGPGPRAHSCSGGLLPSAGVSDGDSDGVTGGEEPGCGDGAVLGSGVCAGDTGAGVRGLGGSEREPWVRRSVRVGRGVVIVVVRGDGSGAMHSTWSRAQDGRPAAIGAGAASAGASPGNRATDAVMAAAGTVPANRLLTPPTRSNAHRPSSETTDISGRCRPRQRRLACVRSIRAAYASWPRGRSVLSTITVRPPCSRRYPSRWTGISARVSGPIRPRAGAAVSR